MNYIIIPALGMVCSKQGHPRGGEKVAMEQAPSQGFTPLFPSSRSARDAGNQEIQKATRKKATSRSDWIHLILIKWSILINN